MRGMFLFELYVVSVFLAKKDESLRGEALRRTLSDLKSVLQEAIEILSYEPENTLEGMRCKSAQEYMKNLDVMIKQIGQAVEGKAIK